MPDIFRIEVVSCVQLTTTHGHLMDILPMYDIDRAEGALTMPMELIIGSKSWDGHPIITYADQVGEYAVWLEDAIRDQQPKILIALDSIYNMAITTGVVLVTLSTPVPFHTHAHEVRRAIRELAK